MKEIQFKSLIHPLSKRRRELRMSYAVLAKRSGVSMPTVVRILSGRYAHPSFGNVLAIAAALGMSVKVEPTIKALDLLEDQAKQKANRLVGLVQGTSGLEGQALDEEALDAMMRQTIHELLAGSNRGLWEE